MGTTLLAEYEGAMARERLFRACRAGCGGAPGVPGHFLAPCRLTPISFGWRPNLRDEGDKHLVELAVAGQASCIVSRNLRDLCHADANFSVEPPTGSSTEDI